jgi:hypothetical protein
LHYPGPGLCLQFIGQILEMTSPVMVAAIDATDLQAENIGPVWIIHKSKGLQSAMSHVTGKYESNTMIL